VKKALSLALTLALAACASLLAWLWRARAALTYNEAGRYYDGADGVVYDDGAVLIYGLLALLFGLLLLASVLMTARLWPR